MSEKQQQPLSIKIDHGEEGFYSDSISIVFNPGKFILDFKQNSPRVDQIHGKNHQTVLIKHKAVVLDVGFAKVFMETLKQSVEKYEKTYGKIPVPKKMKVKEQAVMETKSESYIG